MKKIKKIICLCTAFLMISSLVSCSSGKNSTALLSNDKTAASLSDTNDKDKKAPKITQYYDELTVEGTEDFTNIFKMKYSGDKLYVCGQKNSEKNYSMFSTDLTTLETSGTQKDTNIPDDCEEKDICKDSKGNIYCWSYGAVKVYDKDLKLIKTIDNEFFKDHDDVRKLYYYSSTVSENGDIYIAASEKTSQTLRIIKLNSSFELQYITENGAFSDCGDSIEKIFIGQNGNLVLCTSSDSTYINEISPDTGTTTLRYELPLVEEVLGGCGDYNIIYQNGSEICGYNYLDDSTSELYSTDVNVSEIKQAYIRGNLLITEQLEKSNSENVLSVYDKDGKSEKEITFSGIDQISDMRITSDGKVFLLNEHYAVDYSDDGGYETTQPEIICVKEDGTTQSVYMGEKQYTEIHYKFAADSKGNICIYPDSFSDDNTIHATYISSDGQQTDMTYDCQGYIRNVMCINDELTILLYSYEKNSMSFLTVNKDTRTLDKPSSETELPSYDLSEGNSGYDLYYSAGNVVNGYHMSDGSTDKIFSWFDTDVDSVPMGDISTIAIADSDNIFYVKNAEYHSVFDEYSDPENQFPLSVIHLKKADEARLKELNNRNIISLAGIRINQEYFSKIKRFNKSSNDYMIMATDYSQYNSFMNDGNSEGLSKMETDIAQGNIPDIILGDWSLDIQNYLSKDAFADLNDFLRDDHEIDKTDLAENILDACTYNDKLYCIPRSFTLRTLSVAQDCCENSDMLTFDEFFNLADSFSDKSLINSTRENILELLVSSYINENIDFSNATCSFDTDTFRKILEKIKPCVSQDEFYSEKYNQDNGGTAMENSLFKDTDIRDLQSVFYSMTGNDGDQISYKLKGIPSSSGITSLMNLGSYLCITKESENKEGAWQFIKYFTDLGGKQDEDSYSGDIMMSVLRSENQKAIETIKSNVSDDKYMDLNQSDIDRCTQYLDTLCNGKMINNNNYLKLLQIISEQAETFFNDTQSLDESVSAIQSKVNLYLSEIK